MNALHALHPGGKIMSRELEAHDRVLRSATSFLWRSHFEQHQPLPEHEKGKRWTELRHFLVEAFKGW